MVREGLVMKLPVVVLFLVFGSIYAGMDTDSEIHHFLAECMTKSAEICKRKVYEDVIINLLRKLQNMNTVCQKGPSNCYELLLLGNNRSGVYTIYPHFAYPSFPVSVYCDQDTDQGGWTVFQRRDSAFPVEDFFRSWFEYEIGFGNLTGEFWLGLSNIHALTANTLQELRIDMEDFEGEKRYAKYSAFHVDGQTSKYRLRIKGYSGNAGDALITTHNKNSFSTEDSDNDVYDQNCALSFKGGWWYGKCHDSNLNGLRHTGHHESYADGINWLSWHGHHYSLKKVDMKVRPAYRSIQELPQILEKAQVPDELIPPSA